MGLIIFVVFLVLLAFIIDAIKLLWQKLSVSKGKKKHNAIYKHSRITKHIIS
jgi:hypothetical protein